MILFVTELAIETCMFVIKKTFNYGYYLVYGTQESKEDKILKQMEKIMEQNEIIQKNINLRSIK